MKIVGKEFILLCNNSEESTYKVVGICGTENEITYQARFVGCIDSLDISSDEMEMMLKDSVIVE
jgi:hypothetical protein